MNTRLLTNTFAVAVSAVALAVTPMTAGAGWTYDADTKVLADTTGWALTATASGSALSITGVGSYSGTDGVLDLSTGVADGYRVTELKALAFAGNSQLTALIAPDSLLTIGAKAAYQCPNLGRLEIVSPVLTSIGYNAFDRCTNLNDVVLQVPALTELGSQAFWGAPMATSDATRWDLSGLQTVGTQALGTYNDGSYCPGPTGTLVLARAKSLGIKAIYRRGGLNRVELRSPELTEIPREVFCGCTNLTQLVLDLPALETVGEKAFADTPLRETDWRDLNLPGLRKIEVDGFSFGVISPSLSLGSSCGPTGTLSLVGIEKLGVRAFARRNGMTRCDIQSAGLTNLFGACFEGCDNLGTVTLQTPALYNIGQTAFRGDKALSDLIIGTTNLGLRSEFQSFYGCGNITNITFHGPAPTNTVYSLDRILESVPVSSTGMYSCVIHADLSMDRTGWGALGAAFIPAETEDSRPARCFGVYTEGKRKAWMADDVVSPWRKAGRFLIRICGIDPLGLPPRDAGCFPGGRGNAPSPRPAGRCLDGAMRAPDLRSVLFRGRSFPEPVRAACRFAVSPLGDGGAKDYAPPRHDARPSGGPRESPMGSPSRTDCRRTC